MLSTKVGCGLLLVLGLVACAAPLQTLSTPQVATALRALLPADVVMLGEQHDNPDHPRIQREVIDLLATQKALAAVVIEMATQGQSTHGLSPAASEADVKTALNWDDKAWAWQRYAPAIMVAVRAGVPVVGANLPRAQMREAMANAALDTRLNSAAFAQQTQAIREGHCDVLPAAQIKPMTRIQIARDVAMAQVALQAVAAAKPVGGAGAVAQTLVLIAGSGHVDKTLGVPQHLPPQLRSKSVLLRDATAAATSLQQAGFDSVWPTQPGPDKDYCAELGATHPGPTSNPIPPSPRP